MFAASFLKENVFHSNFIFYFNTIHLHRFLFILISCKNEQKDYFLKNSILTIRYNLIIWFVLVLLICYVKSCWLDSHLDFSAICLPAWLCPRSSYIVNSYLWCNSAYVYVVPMTINRSCNFDVIGLWSLNTTITFFICKNKTLIYRSYNLSFKNFNFVLCAWSSLV